MIRYRIEMPRVLRDLVRHLPSELKAKLKATLRSISDDPYHAKELRDELAGLRSYRVARSRVIYRIVGSMVQIVALGPRADIYERAAAELSKTLRKRQNRLTKVTAQRNSVQLTIGSKRLRLPRKGEFRLQSS
jgi:mRNA-degrading endonuclease RelE of RelBE toxin-antitoxin system